jgi:WhiB family redox-sensing transcriptional regulator
VSAPTRKRAPRLTDAQVLDRQRSAAAMRVTGMDWDDIAASLGLAHQRWARDIVAAAIRKGIVRETDLPEPLDASLPATKGCRRGFATDYDLPDWVDPDWRERAGCRSQDPELFFPIGDNWTQGEARGRAAEAKAFCNNACPVKAECLADAVACRDDWAIRGGLTPDERRPLLAKHEDNRRTA